MSESLTGQLSQIDETLAVLERGGIGFLEFKRVRSNPKLAERLVESWHLGGFQPSTPQEYAAVRCIGAKNALLWQSVEETWELELPDKVIKAKPRYSSTTLAFCAGKTTQQWFAYSLGLSVLEQREKKPGFGLEPPMLLNPLFRAKHALGYYLIAFLEQSERRLSELQKMMSSGHLMEWSFAPTSLITETIISLVRCKGINPLVGGACFASDHFEWQRRQYQSVVRVFSHRPSEINLGQEWCSHASLDSELIPYLVVVRKFDQPE